MVGAARDALSRDPMPRVVAILPFKDEVSQPWLAEQVRKAFYNHFSSKPYTDVKLPKVDERVVQLEKSTGKSVFDLDPGEVGRHIGCDGLVYGKITNYVHLYALVYSQLACEAEVWMVDSKTGKEIFRVKDSVRYHGTSLPTSPLGAVMSAVSAATNLREIQYVRLINELCYKLNEKIPTPDNLAVDQGPFMKEVITNAAEGPFGKRAVIHVGLEGEKGLVATFGIGSFKKGIPMKETEPGIYVGEYHVMPGDGAKEMPIIVSLTRVGGGETEWMDVSGVVTINTTPPPTVTGIRAKGFHDGIEVSWEPLKDVPDLKGYKVFRSEQPLTDFSEIASTELSSVEDTPPKTDSVYYYRVIAFDRAGNESDPQDAARAALTPKEPPILAGEIRGDVVLSGAYIVKEELIVPKGCSLTLEAGTTLTFDAMACLIVRGRLVVRGTESPVELTASSDTAWKGVSLEDGNIEATGLRVKGAALAISVSNTDGIINGAVIAGNEDGVAVTGLPSAAIANSIISGNNRALVLTKTDAKIAGNSIFQNKEGIVAKGFSGQIVANNVFDNDVNLSSDDPLKVDANYFGSIRIEEMHVTNVSVTKTYDDKIPGGKIVDAESDPFSVMSIEERRKKGTELADEGLDYFRKRNYGKASLLFEASLRAEAAPERYHYLAIAYQEMKEDGLALTTLKEAHIKFPRDPDLARALGILLYQKGEEGEATKMFSEALRLNGGDGQARFFLDRMSTGTSQ